jgi:hypothetical protein
MASGYMKNNTSHINEIIHVHTNEITITIHYIYSSSPTREEDNKEEEDEGSEEEEDKEGVDESNSRGITIG